MDSLSDTILSSFRTTTRLTENLIYFQKHLQEQNVPMSRELERILQQALDLASQQAGQIDALAGMIKEDTQLAVGLKDDLATAATSALPANQAIILAVRLNDAPLTTFRESLRYVKPERQAKLLAILQEMK